MSASRDTDLNELTSRLAETPDDGALRIEIALALAGRAEYEPALDHLLGVIRDRGDAKDDARTAMLDIFEVLGDGHPLTTTYRRLLASALF